MGEAIAEKIYSVKEYLELEKNSEVRHEFYYGKLIEMPGESKTANQIAYNCRNWFENTIGENGYNIFDHDVKLQVKVSGIYRYPDVIVALEADDDDEYIVKQPALIVEVASENSTKIDRHTKLKEYIKLQTLQYYIIVSQYEWAVEVFSREGTRWLVDVFTEKEDIIPLSHFSIELPLSVIYKKSGLVGQQKSDY
jgi:Uma2 family endonuclease